MAVTDGQITTLLREWRAGKPQAIDRLFEAVYPRLREIAGALFRGESLERVLQPTSVVNELFLKLVQSRELRFEDRVLIDHARARRSCKREGGTQVPLEAHLAWIEADDVDVLDLDRALNELDALDPRKCHMAELRFFLGFSAQETSQLLAVSKATVDRELRFVRGWLFDRLRPAAI
jgi:RNA polymerase sigma factor (TIGR02999 family)